MSSLVDVQFNCELKILASHELNWFMDHYKKKKKKKKGEEERDYIFII